MGQVSNAANLFYVLNNLYPGDPVTPGQKYKFVAVN
jgi:predicted Zn-dependent protease